MITHSRLAEIRKKLFGRKLAKRPKPPNEAERLYLGAMRGWANNFKLVVSTAIGQTYPELMDPANVRKDGFDPEQPRDEGGRWTGGGDASKAGTSASGTALKPRAFEWTTPAGVMHRFTDKPGERDTYEFKQADKSVREGEAKERMYEAISEHAAEHPGFDYRGANFKKDKDNPGHFKITHEHNELGEKAKKDIFEPGGSYRRADGTQHLDAFDLDQPRDEGGKWSASGALAGLKSKGLLAHVTPRTTRAESLVHQAKQFEGKDPTAVATSKEFYAGTNQPIQVTIYHGGQVGIINGNHRIAAAVAAGATKIRADVAYLGPRGGFKFLERGAELPIGPGTRTDAIRIGPMMLGKRASKVLAGITNPLRAAADRVPLSQVGGTVRSHVEHDVPRYMPGLKNTDLFLGSEISAWRKENTDLITNLSDEMLERIGDLLEDYDGTRVEDVATALEDSFGMTRARAELIARDQTLKLNGRMNQQAQTAAGVDRYRWSTSNDGSVRDDPKGRGDPNHEILNNTVHSWDDPPVTCERTGATNHPGQDYQCRCIAIPVLEEFDDATGDLPED